MHVGELWYGTRRGQGYHGVDEGAAKDNAN